MRRTNYRNRVGRSCRRFCAENSRLLLYLCCMILGIVGGLMLMSSSYLTNGSMSSLAEIEPIGGSLSRGVTQVFSSCFSVASLLLILFICGLSACGIPVTVLIPIFYGLGLGLTQAFWGAQGGHGLLMSAVFIWPHSLIEMIVLIMGCCESLRMSLLIAGQLLPSGSIGGLWKEFKLYLTRFLLFIALAFVAGIVDVGLRTVFLPMLQ